MTGNDDHAAAPPRPGVYDVFRNRDFLLYLAGRFVAVFGQQMFAMAIGWEIYDRTGSALNLGLVGLTQLLPMFLLTLPAGHLADTINRKRIIVSMSLAIAVLNAGLAALSSRQAPVTWIYAGLFATAAARTILGAATASFLPQLVSRREFPRAVSWNSGSFQLASILGPLAAGAVIDIAHHQAWPVYAFNCGAALFFCALVSRLRHAGVTPVREDLTGRSLLGGFRFVFENRIVLGIISLDMFAVLLGGATALLPIYAKDILAVGPRGLGLLQAALPAGAILCFIWLAHRPPLQRAGRALLGSVAAFGLATIGFGFSTWFWFSFAMLFACGAVDGVSVVVRHTLVQMLTPDEKRGRVSAVNNLFIGTSNELGEFESGLVAHGFGPLMGHAIATGAIISVVSGGVGTLLVVLAIAHLFPEIRRYGRLDAH